VKRLPDVVEIFASSAPNACKTRAHRRRPGPRRREFLVRKYCLQKDVFFLGKQDNVYEKLSAAIYSCFPRSSNPFGLAALEAMACEVPVIATKVGGVPKFVTHSVDGFLVEPGDVQAAARYSIELLSRADRGREMGKNRPHQRQEKLLRQRRHPAYEALLQARPVRILITARTYGTK